MNRTFKIFLVLYTELIWKNADMKFQHFILKFETIVLELNFILLMWGLKCFIRQHE